MGVEKELVNEESDEEGYEDEGYKSLIDTAETERKNGRRRKPDVETLTALDENTKEELKEKILILKEAYDDLKDDLIRLEFEVDCLKDDQEEREEEMRLKKTELLLMADKLKVSQKETAGDKKIIKRQQDIITTLEKKIQGEDV